MPAKTFWDIDGAVAELQKLRKEGFSASRIAGVLTVKYNSHISRNAVLGKLDRIGLGGLIKFGDPRHHRKKPPAHAVGWRKFTRMEPKPSPVYKAMRAPPEPLPQFEPELVIPLQERKSIETLEQHDCRWPIGHVGEPDFHFCGKKKVGGISYCEFHAKRSVQPLSPPSSRPFVLFGHKHPAAVKEDA